MSIEINNSNVRPDRTVNETSEQARAREGAAERRADEAQQQKARLDSVELSRDAHSLQRLQDRLDREESFDAKRVDEIKQAIEDGRYPIDAERLARNFFDLERQLNQ